MGYIYIWDGVGLPLLYFSSQYQLEGETFFQATILIERDEGFFNQFTYTAPEHLFEDYSDIAEDMWDSLDII